MVRVEFRFWKMPWYYRLLALNPYYGHVAVYLPIDQLWLNRSLYEDRNGWLTHYAQDHDYSISILVKEANIAKADAILQKPYCKWLYPVDNCVTFASVIASGSRKLCSMQLLLSFLRTVHQSQTRMASEVLESLGNG